MHSWKSPSFNNTSVWIKRKVDPNFDVPMGSFDCAGICELVGMCNLDILGKKYGKEKVGLYRDNSLDCFKNIGVPQAEKIRKDNVKTIKQVFGDNITSETNLKIVNFLDITLNVSTGKYQP